MFSDLVRINVVDRWSDPKGTWAYVEAGDMLVYDEGASYFVEKIAVEDSSQTTFALRAIVPPREDDMKFWDVCYISVGKHASLPRYVTLTKG